MRIWRAIKALGCAALRDGAYLLPAQAEVAAELRTLADEAQQEEGQAWLLRVQADDAEAGQLQPVVMAADADVEPLGVAAQADRGRVAVSILHRRNTR